MRPLIVDLGREYRGGQHQALLLLQGLFSRGHAPELITTRNSLLAERATDSGITVWTVSPRWRRIAAALRIHRLLRERRADIVHANEPHALTSAWLARAHRHVPLVAARRIALPLSPSAISIARYRAATRIIAISHFVEQSVIHSGLPTNSVTVIYDGVAILPLASSADRERARRQVGIPPDARCVGNIAAFVPEKGHVLLLDAFAELRAHVPGCVLLLRGDGPERATMQELAAKLRIGDAVKFLPPTVEIETMFAAMDIFAFPSHDEPLGSALLAAMAHGLPVVAIARGGVPEAVGSGTNGLLVESLNSTAFSDAMARLIGNSPAALEEARRLGSAARETVAARFSADRMVDATLKCYEDLVAARR